jgi:leader peptidase (prepilin peptidase) / N-methyltransferase
MMMAGSFLGWQPILVAFFVSVIPGLFFGILHVVRRGNQPLPFGPSLAIGVVTTLLGWPVIGDHFRVVFFDPVVLGLMVAAGAVLALVLSFLLRLLGGKSKVASGKGG